MKSQSEYRLVASDVDGTLLKPDGTVGELTRQAVRMIQSRGIEFLIVTGRNDLLTTEIVGDLNTNGLVVGCNGATVRNILTGELYVEEFIEKDDLKTLIQFFMEHQILFSFYSINRCYCLDINVDFVNSLQERYFKISPDEKFGVEVLRDPTQLLALDESIIKVCTFGTEPRAVVSMQQTLNQLQGIEAFRPDDHVLDLVRRGVSKGNALRKYAENAGITPAQIVAMGDGNNDISMLQYAGMAVAMKNGTSEIFEHADMITDTNVADGAGKALIQLFSLPIV